MGEGRDVKDQLPENKTGTNDLHNLRQQVFQWMQSKLPEKVETPVGTAERSSTDKTSIQVPTTPIGSVDVRQSQKDGSSVDLTNQLLGTVHFQQSGNGGISIDLDNPFLGMIHVQRSHANGILVNLPETQFGTFSFQNSPAHGAQLNFKETALGTISFQKSQADGISITLPDSQLGSFALRRSPVQGTLLNLTETPFGSLGWQSLKGRSSLNLRETPFGTLDLTHSQRDSILLNSSHTELGNLRFQKSPIHGTAFNLTQTALGTFELRQFQGRTLINWANIPVGLSFNFQRLPGGADSLKLQDDSPGTSLHIGRSPSDHYGKQLEIRNSEVGAGIQLRETPSGAAVKVDGVPAIIIPRLLTNLNIDLPHVAWPLTFAGRSQNGLTDCELKIGPERSSVHLTTDIDGWRLFTHCEKHGPLEKLLHDPLRNTVIMFGAESRNTRILVTEDTSEGPRILLTRRLGPGEEFFLHANPDRVGIEATIGPWSIGARGDFHGRNTTFNLLRRAMPFEADLHINFSRGRKKNHYDGGLQIRITPTNK